MNGLAIPTQAFHFWHTTLGTGIYDAARSGVQEARTRWEKGGMGHSNYMSPYNWISTIPALSSPDFLWRR